MVMFVGRGAAFTAGLGAATVLGAVLTGRGVDRSETARLACFSVFLVVSLEMRRETALVEALAVDLDFKAAESLAGETLAAETLMVLLAAGFFNAAFFNAGFFNAAFFTAAFFTAAFFTAALGFAADFLGVVFFACVTDRAGSFFLDAMGHLIQSIRPPTHFIPPREKRAEYKSPPP